MKIERVAMIVSNAIMILIIAFLLYANISYYVFGQIVLAVVKGKSMYPLLQENDMVIVVHSKDIELGDVVVFKNDRGEYVIHRVIAIAECKDGNRVYITKGDYNAFVDSASPIAFRSSVLCHIDDLKVLKGFERFVVPEIHNNMIRGIPGNRIVGKAFSLMGATVKVSGIPQIKISG